MKIELNNGQGVPYLVVKDGESEKLKVSFCKDGGIVEVGEHKIGTKIGCRDKGEIADAQQIDGIELGDI